MCGIFFSLCRERFKVPDGNTRHLLENRGPDHLGTEQILIPSNAALKEISSPRLHATFISTVLALRGTAVAEQPLKDDTTGSILCWNGEAWNIADRPVVGNDSRAVFEGLLKSCESKLDEPGTSVVAHVVQTLASIQGPYAFVFYDAVNQHLFYGRDCLGRRSLLVKATANDELVLSSVCDNVSGDAWAEVDADGIYVLDLAVAVHQPTLAATLIPQRRQSEVSVLELHFITPFPSINRSANASNTDVCINAIQNLGNSLRDAVALRVQRVREAQDVATPYQKDSEPRVAILFSGGLDCTLLARLAHDVLPTSQGIDLLNVAFENPRIHGKLAPSDSPYELCPDRITGRSSHVELMRVCRGRHWCFVEINIPYSETLAHRTKVMSLMHPHNTEMDLSISLALYFASKGTGITHNSAGKIVTYDSSARVLLSGLGADELFGGYQRHATAFSRQGYSGLIEELELDFDRLGKRNLGRDDRILSDSGKEVRFPFLDENFISFALQLPVQAKCDFGSPPIGASDDPTKSLEPGKRILRLLAWQLGIKGVAAEKKRAIQFGARTAKMETGKTKGTHVLT